MQRALQGLLMATEEMRDAVLANKKKITIRQGHRDYTPGPVLIGCHILNWAVVRHITDVRHTTLDRVTEEECKADGCENHQELLDLLKQFYPELGSYSQVTVIRWE